jgi:ABC1 atypical kinase-like domain
LWPERVGACDDPPPTYRHREDRGGVASRRVPALHAPLSEHGDLLRRCIYNISCCYSRRKVVSPRNVAPMCRIGASVQLSGQKLWRFRGIYQQEPDETWEDYLQRSARFCRETIEADQERWKKERGNTSRMLYFCLTTTVQIASTSREGHAGGEGQTRLSRTSFDVWPRQTSSVTATFAPCGLICTETFASQRSSSILYFSSPLTPRQYKLVCRFPPLFVVSSKQAHLFWGWALLIIAQHVNGFIDLMGVYHEFKHTIYEEIDYVREAANARRFKELFKDGPYDLHSAFL